MDVNLSGFTETEREALEHDNLILVDESDNVVGTASKLESHLAEKPLLHRAFSVFLFSVNGECYLQRRASTKVLFPGLVANTVCSHPHAVDDENNGWEGVDAAARRRLVQEIGLELPADFKFYHLRRVLYKSTTVVDTPSGQWAEYEMDYILIGLLPSILMDSTSLAPAQMRSTWKTRLNSAEVSELRPWTMEEVESTMQTSPQTFSPWFRLLYNSIIRSFWVRLMGVIRDGTETPSVICSEMTRETILDLRSNNGRRHSLSRAY